MALLKWQWTLANRGSVTAVLDTDAKLETVLQGERVFSRAPRGSLADGHEVVVAPGPVDAGRSERPPIAAVVTFDPEVAVCVLRVDGHEVAPAVWPKRERPAEPPPPRRWGLPLFFVLVLLIAALLFVMRPDAPANGPSEARLFGNVRSMNGLFIAHYPEDELEPKLPVLPTGVGGVVLENKQHTLTIVIAAAPAEAATGAPPDAWSVQQWLREEALANVPKGVARFEEDGRREETCLGERGAVVTGRLAHRSSRRGRVWSCAFLHKEARYLVLYALAEPAAPVQERHAHEIVEATELTRLSDLGALPEPSASAGPLIPH